MLGLTRLNKTTSTADQRKLFSVMYCTACRATLPSTGRLPLSFLPYEAAFLLLILEALSKDEWPRAKSPCTLAPIVRRGVARPPVEVAHAIADIVQVALALDHADAVDDGDRRIAKFITKSAFSNLEEKPYAKQLFDECRLLMREHGGVEGTAEVYRELFGHAADATHLAPAATLAVEEIGARIGRLTHIVDDLMDAVKDAAAGRPASKATREYAVAEIGELAELVVTLQVNRHKEELEAVLHGIGASVHRACRSSQRTTLPSIATGNVEEAAV